MLTPAKILFLKSVNQQAISSDHVWRSYAACEAALENNWGTSQLAQAANNLFGTKQHEVPAYDTLTLPTREYLAQGTTGTTGQVAGNGGDIKFISGLLCH